MNIITEMLEAEKVEGSINSDLLNRFRQKKPFLSFKQAVFGEAIIMRNMSIEDRNEIKTIVENKNRKAIKPKKVLTSKIAATYNAGQEITHRVFGKGVVISSDSKVTVVQFGDVTKNLVTRMVV